MNEITDFRSLPWHAFQRSLAVGFAIDAPGLATTPITRVGIAAPTAGDSSWLSRARSAVPPSRQANRRQNI
jgi:hypothetical protein